MHPWYIGAPWLLWGWIREAKERMLWGWAPENEVGIIGQGPLYHAKNHPLTRSGLLSLEAIPEEDIRV